MDEQTAGELGKTSVEDGCRVAEFAFADIFLREYGQMLKPKDWGFTTMASLLQALGDVLEVRYGSQILC